MYLIADLSVILGLVQILIPFLKLYITDERKTAGPINTRLSF